MRDSGLHEAGLPVGPRPGRRWAIAAMAGLVAASAVFACTSILRVEKFKGEAADALLGYYSQNLADDWAEGSEVLYSELNRDQVEAVELSLAAGQYAAVLGSCDDACSNLNIEVADATGLPVGRDTDEGGTAKFPFVEIPSRDSATYMVQIGMADCTEEPCYVAYLVLRDRSETVEALNQVYRDDWVETHPRRSIVQSYNVGEGRPVAVEREFQPGQGVVVLAACDQNCVDLNIEVLDAGGLPVARNEDRPGTGRYPFARFTPRATGMYRIEIGIAECAEDPCTFAYMVVREDLGDAG